MSIRNAFRALLAVVVLVAAVLPVRAQSHAADAPRQFLWEVTSLTNRVYLYGTVHAGKASFYPLPEAVLKSFGDAKVLAVEADITNDEEMAKGTSSMLLTPPDKLSAHVPPPVYERFRRQLVRFDMKEEVVAHLKPFFAASLLGFAQWGQLGYIAQYGVDVHLLRKAREQGKEIVELEGAQAQSELMNSLSEKEGVQALEGIVSALESGLTRDQITGMVGAWSTGDANKLLEVARAYNESVPGARELEQKFIWSRHDKMVGKIERWLLDGRKSVFVAVGALHLAGPEGLVELLRRRGFEVKQL